MTDETPRLELAHVHVEHYERIELVDIDVGPGVTVVSGNNANGKTSLIEAVRQLFGGSKARRVPTIATGADSAKVVAVLNADGAVAFTVEQELRAGKSDRLVIRDADGVPTGHGQEWLKSLVGRGLAIDPSRFFDPPGARTPEARDKARVEMLLQVCPLPLDLVEHAAKREAAYKKRTAVNRDVETASGKINTLAKRPVPEAIDLAAKRAEIAKERSRDGDRRHHASEIARIDREMEEIRQRFKKLEADRALHVAAAQTLGEPVDVSALEAAVTAGEKSNLERERILAANRQYDETLADLGKWNALSDNLTAEIKALDEAKVAALAAAKFPIPSLSITETQVMLGALPYESASTAERMAAAFAICAAEKPTLGLALIDDAEKFDLATLDTVREVARALDVKVLMARRSPDIAASGKVELVDGRVPEATS